ncbi:MAG: tetraacyldisaccharide 4'-kinase, partial [Verrucomicrobiae bacterium]|nr:tetraacyldisaccharide 4'-kinase [Verrucomicrobiae bacterium]
CPWGYGAVLPRGLLREPLSSLKRADFAILTRADQVSESEREKILATISKYHPTLPCGQVAFAPRRLVNSEGETQGFSDVQGKLATAFCGIGNPRGFLQTLSGFGVTVEESQLLTFADHHHYSESDFEAILRQAQQRHAEVLLTTQKDLVKIPRTHLGDLPLWAVEIGAEWRAGESELAARLNPLVDGLERSS